MVLTNLIRIVFNNRRFAFACSVSLVFSAPGCDQSTGTLPRSSKGAKAAAHPDRQETLDRIDYFAERASSDREAEALRVLRTGGARIFRDVVDGKLYTLVHLDGTWNGETPALEHIEELDSVGEISFPSNTASEQFEILSHLKIDLRSILVRSAELSDKQSDTLRKNYPNASLFDGSEYLIHSEAE